MLNNKRIIVVMPAYRAAATLEKTYRELDLDVIDEVIVVDDCSPDRMVEVCRQLEIPHICHRRNLGYGGNQKTCYSETLQHGADIIIMIHPDYQYDPRLAPALAEMVASGASDVALGSRILGKGALVGGMPLYRYAANRFLTLVPNFLCGQKLSEYHTGYRAYSSDVLRKLPLEENSNNFIFDNEILGQIIYFGFRIGEVSIPTRYAGDSSSINLIRSIRYGFGVLGVSIKLFLQRNGIAGFRIFKPAGRSLGSCPGHSDR